MPRGSVAGSTSSLALCMTPLRTVPTADHSFGSRAQLSQMATVSTVLLGTNNTMLEPDLIFSLEAKKRVRSDSCSSWQNIMSVGDVAPDNGLEPPVSHGERSARRRELR